MKNFVPTLHFFYQQMRTALQDIYPDAEARNITQLIFEKILNIPYTAIVTDKAKLIAPAENIRLQTCLKKLLAKMPVQYVLEEAWFYKYPFYVNPSVLIPRPETEELILWIAQEFVAPTRILDIGTGSGCIAITLKKIMPESEVFAIDISPAALFTAQKNALALGCSVAFLQIDFLTEENWSALPKFDCIVSNPPYIPMEEKKTLPSVVLDYEPHRALFVEDENPFIFYKKIALFGKKQLNKKGKIFVEIHEKYGTPIENIFMENGYKTLLKKDFQGKDRILQAIPA